MDDNCVCMGTYLDVDTAVTCTRGNFNQAIFAV